MLPSSHSDGHATVDMVPRASSNVTTVLLDRSVSDPTPARSSVEDAVRPDPPNKSNDTTTPVELQSVEDATRSNPQDTDNGTTATGNHDVLVADQSEPTMNAATDPDLAHPGFNTPTSHVHDESRPSSPTPTGLSRANGDVYITPPVLGERREPTPTYHSTIADIRRHEDGRQHGSTSSLVHASVVRDPSTRRCHLVMRTDTPTHSASGDLPHRPHNPRHPVTIIPGEYGPHNDRLAPMPGNEPYRMNRQLSRFDPATLPALSTSESRPSSLRWTNPFSLSRRDNKILWLVLSVTSFLSSLASICVLIQAYTTPWSGATKAGVFFWVIVSVASAVVASLILYIIAKYDESTARRHRPYQHGNPSLVDGREVELRDFLAAQPSSARTRDRQGAGYSASRTSHTSQDVVNSPPSSAASQTSLHPGFTTATGFPPRLPNFSFPGLTLGTRGSSYPRVRHKSNHRRSRHPILSLRQGHPYSALLAEELARSPTSTSASALDTLHADTIVHRARGPPLKVSQHALLSSPPVTSPSTHDAPESGPGKALPTPPPRGSLDGYPSPPSSTGGSVIHYPRSQIIAEEEARKIRASDLADLMKAGVEAETEAQLHTHAQERTRTPSSVLELERHLQGPGTAELKAYLSASTASVVSDTLSPISPLAEPQALVLQNQDEETEASDDEDSLANFDFDIQAEGFTEHFGIVRMASTQQLSRPSVAPRKVTIVSPRQSAQRLRSPLFSDSGVTEEQQRQQVDQGLHEQVKHKQQQHGIQQNAVSSFKPKEKKRDISALDTPQDERHASNEPKPGSKLPRSKAYMQLPSFPTEPLRPVTDVAVDPESKSRAGGSTADGGTARPALGVKTGNINTTIRAPRSGGKVPVFGAERTKSGDGEGMEGSRRVQNVGKVLFGEVESEAAKPQGKENVPPVVGGGSGSEGAGGSRG